MTLRSKPKSEMRVMRDGRVILSGKLYQRMKWTLCEMAGKFCESCGKYTPEFVGQVHHVDGRGAGKRDDRIFVEGQQKLRWYCPGCHGKAHVPEKVVPSKVTDEELRTILGVKP